MLYLYWNVFNELWVRRDLTDRLSCNYPLLLLKWPLLDMVRQQEWLSCHLCSFCHVPFSNQQSKVRQLYSLTSKRMGKPQVGRFWDSESLWLFNQGCKRWFIFFWASSSLTQVRVNLKCYWCKDFFTAPLTLLIPVFIMKFAPFLSWLELGQDTQWESARICYQPVK